MASAAAKGSHYKARTKVWLERQGYQVAFMERMMLIGHGRRDAFGNVRPPFPVKQDQFASDLLAVNDAEIIFVQCKLGRKNVAAAIREFAKFRFPDVAKRWVVVWEKGDRAPEIIDANHQIDNAAADPPDITFPPVRRRAPKEPRLFR